MRVLITGASGRLGGRLAQILSADFEVVAGCHRRGVPAGLASTPLSLATPDSLVHALETVRPDAIVHSAALANADACENDPLLAHTINVEAAARLARLCRRLGVRLIALSTDLVFDGRTAPARERDGARPILLYGRTKLLGEQAILMEAPDAAIVRVALVCGRGFGAAGTASETILWALRAGRAVKGFTDQRRTPVDPESVCFALSALLRNTLRGLFHVGGQESLSRYDLALRVARLFSFPEQLIIPARQASSPIGVTRPADVSLATDRARRELGFAPRPLDTALGESRPAPPTCADP